MTTTISTTTKTNHNFSFNSTTKQSFGIFRAYSYYTIVQDSNDDFIIKSVML